MWPAPLLLPFVLGLPTGLGMPVGLVAVPAAALHRLVVVQSQPSFSLLPAAASPAFAAHLPAAAAAAS